MNLEEIKKARAIEYNFTIENWDTITPLRDPMWDIDLLVAEVERQRRHRKWALETGRGIFHAAQKSIRNMYKRENWLMEDFTNATRHAEKAEAELEDEKRLHQACMEAAAKQTADLSTCKERVREAFKQGWDDALECMEAEKGINGFPNEAQKENGWYAYQCQRKELFTDSANEQEKK